MKNKTSSYGVLTDVRFLHVMSKKRKQHRDTGQACPLKYCKLSSGPHPIKPENQLFMGREHGFSRKSSALGDSTLRISNGRWDEKPPPQILESYCQSEQIIPTLTDQWPDSVYSRICRDSEAVVGVGGEWPGLYISCSKCLWLWSWAFTSLETVMLQESVRVVFVLQG